MRTAHPAPFRHTQAAVYIATLVTVSLITCDSAQVRHKDAKMFETISPLRWRSLASPVVPPDINSYPDTFCLQTILQRYHINKKWFQLYAVTAFFAYLYVRPLIRKRLGSASQAYINWSTIYILWLCSAVFYHTPSLDSLGVDVKADLSLLLTIFLISLLLLGTLHFLYNFAITFQLLQPVLQEPLAPLAETVALVVLNALNMSLGCSSFYALCGNAGAQGNASQQPVDGIRSSICSKWLRPVPAMRYGVFSSWVLYGEGVDGNRDEMTISPVFTMFVTLFAMFAANCVADYSSLAVIQAAEYTEQSRKTSLVSRRRTTSSSQQQLQRRHSAEMTRFGSDTSLLSFFTTAEGINAFTNQTGIDALLKTMSTVSSTVWSPTAMGLRSASGLFFRDDSGVGLGAKDGTTSQPGSVRGGKKGGGSAVGSKQPPAMVPYNSPAPSFLPMFPWYSGTSADLLKTLFDVVVSVKVFLGRFDMRTMQAAIAGTEGNTSSDPPRDGDGFTFEHLADQQEVWLDFLADTGDGGDSTYSVARCLAAQSISVAVPTKELQGKLGSKDDVKILPRASAVVHGGDLAYPSPSDETYEQRLFGPYEAALPPPAHVHPGHLVLNKPDLPAEYWRQEHGCKCGAAYMNGMEKLCKMCQKGAALAAYDGPTCFAIPGNHDWFDGLETFQRHIVHKGWIGGWLMPQERSYFALKLPKGWWMLALDLALVDDIDMLQYRYFAKVAEERMAPGDAAIIITHCPSWLLCWFWGEDKCKNLRQLIRGPLRGRVRVQLAGDLHFYMRHSFQPYQQETNPSLAPSERSTPAGGSPVSGSSPLASRSPTPQVVLGTHPAVSAAFARQVADRLTHTDVGSNRAAGGLTQQLHSKSASPIIPRRPSSQYMQGSSPPGGSPQTATAKQRLSNRTTTTDDGTTTTAGIDIPKSYTTTTDTDIPIGQSPASFPASPVSTTATTADAWQPLGGPSSPPASSTLPSINFATHLPQTPQRQSPLLGQSPPSSASWWPISSLGKLSVTPKSKSSPVLGSHVRAGEEESKNGLPPGWLLNEAEHLITCGSGGAFLHPTHVFANSRFRPMHDPAAGPVFTSKEQHQQFGLRRAYPSSSSLYSLSHADERGPSGGEYRTASCYPTAWESLKLGRLNFHTFRNVNNRFDIIGGALYFFIIFSVLPRCHGVAAIFDAQSLGEALSRFTTAVIATAADILTESYISLAALTFFFALCVAFASGGGVGVVPPDAPRAYGAPGSKRRPEEHGFGPAIKARMGGLLARLSFGGLHCAAHLTAAVCLLLLLELGVETVIRFEGVGKEGYHSLYNWYRAFEAEHFPDPAGLRGRLSTWTLGLYPNALKWLMAVFDVPEAIAVSRTSICTNGLSALTRIQSLGYYGGVLMYFWVLATPTVGFLFGLYLYISVNIFNLHYDEAFSSLQVPDCKGFLRLHITRNGDLEVFALGMDKVPKAWREDPRWRAPSGGGNQDLPSHKAANPSRWLPIEEGASQSSWGLVKTAQLPEERLKLVDYLVVPKRAA